MKIIKKIRCLMAFLLSSITMSITVLLCLPIALMPERRYDSRIYHKFINTCSHLIFFFNSIKYKIHGKNNLLWFENNPAIYIANHSSSLDIPFLEIILKDQPKIWISKTSYSKIPLFGFILKRMHVIVDRDNLFAVKKVISKTLKLTENKKRHLVLFPEGRRYADGKIHEFFPGFAILAEKLNRPIIPIAINGFNKLLPKNKFCVDSDVRDAKIIIGEPIMYSDFTTREEFIQCVHKWFEKELEKLQKE